MFLSDKEVDMPEKAELRGLMCPPVFFEVRSSINPQMAETLKRGEKVDKVRAFEQWMELVFLLRMFGVRLSYLPPRENFPDMTFTANAGFFHEGKMFLSNFRHKERRGESLEVQSYFAGTLGFPSSMFPLRRKSAPLFFEGQGDALWYGKNLVCGYGRLRSNRGGIEAMRSAIEIEEDCFVPLKIVRKHFYHLDTCFCPMGKDILWYPPAFGVSSRALVRSLVRACGGKAIAVSLRDAARFTCNGIYFSFGGKRALITSPVSVRLKRKLEKLGIEVWENDVSEFLKSGGGNKCLFFLFNERAPH